MAAELRKYLGIIGCDYQRKVGRHTLTFDWNGVGFLNLQPHKATYGDELVVTHNGVDHPLESLVAKHFRLYEPLRFIDGNRFNFTRRNLKGSE
jgi:hypothetical protein